MKREIAVAAVALVGAGIFACGGKTGSSGGGTPDAACGDLCLDSDGGISFDAARLGDVWSQPACGEITPVLAGDAYVGAWQFDTGSKSFKLVPCDAPPGVGPEIGVKRFHVRTFALMSNPATNLCYSECVKRGACSPPEHDINDPDARDWLDDHRAAQPVYVDHLSAAKFCTWLGGRLPTWAEMVRAAQGDAQKPGVAALTDAAINCALSPDGSAICAQISQMDVITGSPKPQLYPVHTVTTDIGPYGHHDLFGTVAWSQSYLTDQAFCGVADGAGDFKTFPQTDPTHPQFFAVEFAGAVLRAVKHPDQRILTGGLSAESTVAYYLGFRCAFD